MKEIDVFAPLYHGTDARIVSMPNESRVAFKQEILSVIDCLWVLFKPLYDRHLEDIKDALDNSGVPNLYFNLYDALIRNSARLRGNELFHYYSFCVTNSIDRAKNYAHRAFSFGEIGLTAYRMIQAKNVIAFENWNPDESVQKAIEKITAFAEDDPKPIVFKFDNILIEDLETESGKSAAYFIKTVGVDFFKQAGNASSFRYLKEVSLDMSKAIYL